MVVVAVGRIGRAHGVRGEVSVQVLTDDPARRFRAGSRLSTPTTDLTIGAVRHHQGRLLVTFEEIGDRTAAEALTGTLLSCEVPTEEDTGEPDTWFDHQLVGLQVRTTDGTPVGQVVRVEHGSAQDLLVVGRDDREALVPFVTAIVPGVEVDGGYVLIDPPGGLLDPLDEAP